MAQELGLLLAEPTFIRVQPNTCNLEPVKHLLQVNHVLPKCFRKHDNIIYIDQAQRIFAMAATAAPYGDYYFYYNHKNKTISTITTIITITTTTTIITFIILLLPYLTSQQKTLIPYSPLPSNSSHPQLWWRLLVSLPFLLALLSLLHPFFSPWRPQQHPMMNTTSTIIITTKTILTITTIITTTTTTIIITFIILLLLYLTFQQKTLIPYSPLPSNGSHPQLWWRLLVSLPFLFAPLFLLHQKVLRGK